MTDRESDLIAPDIDRIGLVDVINEKLETHPLEVISSGIAIEARILNALDLLITFLYLFSQLWLGKVTEHWLGEEFDPEHLNDDLLGRVLDPPFSVQMLYFLYFC